MPFLDLAGFRVHYRIDGPADAPIVMLSNSLGADLTMWASQMKSLVGRYRVLRYDTRAHGQSTAPSGPYTIEQLARDVIGLLDALAIERVHFCGISMGGMIGQWLAINTANRLRKVVLVSTAAKIGTDETWNARIEAVRKGGIESIADAVLARWFTPRFLTAAPDAIAKARTMMVAGDRDGYVRCCEAIRDTDLRERVSAIQVPTLVISSTHDVSTPPTEGRFLVDRINGARYVELPVAHISNIEAADRFNAAFVEFMA